MKNTGILIASILGFLGVALGAFGAHALKETLVANGYQDTWQTGTFYHLLHAVLIFAMSIAYANQPSKALRIAILSATVGVLIFSGTLYLLSVTGIKWLGAITPIGGVAFLVAWACLLFHYIYLQKRS